MYKIEYENLSFGQKEVTYKKIIGSEEELKQSIFDGIHRYCGNHMEGHGVARVIVTSANRPADANINSEIIYLNNLINNHEKVILASLESIKAYEDSLKIPYEEGKLICDIEIGSLPTDEELIADGWDKEQVENRSSKASTRKNS